MRLVFRPHPLLFINFLETGELSREKYEYIIRVFNENDNLILDDPHNDYIDIFNNVDAMITDPTSLLPEFYYTGKPIIYCDSIESFNDAGKIMADGLYYASTWEELVGWIKKLSVGDDVLKIQREKSSTKLNPNQNNGKRICEYILSDYFGE